MASASGSYLSSPKYGYDFVVSTTQASINSGLLTFLNEGNQPIEYICFLVDPTTGSPSSQISLGDLLLKTGGVNPFDIPDGVSYDDPRITALTKALFVVGIKLQIGLPPGVLPKDLPNVVTLGDNANNVEFNLFCSEFTVIQNNPGGWGNPGTWNIWKQPSGQPWYFNTRVNLVIADLDKQLDTPYFNNHLAEKDQLKRQLSQLGSYAFSLQQLLFDLDHAVLQTVPTIAGMPPGSNAQAVLQKSFVSIYSNSAKEHGFPLVSIMASINGADPSPLHLTSFERQVSQLKDSNGVVIQSPTDLQRSVTTLDYLCATDNHPPPGVASFNWNWVLPNEIDSESGVIAINRNSIATYIMNELLPYTYNCCVMPQCSVSAHWWLKIDYHVSAIAGQRPQNVTVTPTGPNVIHIEYTTTVQADDRDAAAYGYIKIQPTYTCDVTFSGSTITVTQHSLVYMYLTAFSTSESLNAYDKTITTTYTISVDQTGGLQLTKTNSTTDDKSESPDVNAFEDFFTDINSIVNTFKSLMTKMGDPGLKEIPFNQLSNFIFPGSKVFTYKSAAFSNNQDLVCGITYVDPTSQFSAADMQDDAVDIEFDAVSVQPFVVAAPPAPALSLDYSTELMQNYIQGEIVSPTSKFEAVQTTDGHSLLFAIDSSGVFHAIQEQSGTSKTGWEIIDLSTALIKDKFPGATDAKVRTFDVGQSALDVSNYAHDTTWLSKPTWNSIPFDASGESGRSITIAGVLFAETSSHSQYLIVDADRPAAISTSKNIARYYIDLSRSTGSYWVNKDVPVDIEQGSYQSCVGRKTRSYVDGVYTSGRSAGAPQLVYVPIANAFGSGPPLPTRLGLPGGALPSAIVTTRYADQTNSTLYGTTDLFAIGGSTLYRFAADAQTDGATGVAVTTNSFLSGTDTLLGMTSNGITTLWGKNGSDEVYYLSCPTSQLNVPGSWSSPVPILTGIERISAYINKTDGGNTIFASGGGKLFQMIQATNTSAKVWRPQEIKVAAQQKQQMIAFKSYTTTIHASKENQPVRDLKLSISADDRAPVYINGLYYVLSQTPIDVTTDSKGSVTVIEATSDLTAAKLTVTIPNSVQSTVISPMDKSFQKLTKLNSEDSLRGASFPSQTKAGGVVGQVSHTPLVATSTASDNLKSVASNMSQLQTIYTDCKPSATTSALTSRSVQPHVVPTSRFSVSSVLSDLGHDISMAAGDIFQWLKSGVTSVIDIIKDSITGAWHFIAKIAGKVYRAILDTVDAVVGAVEWVFNAIKTGVEELIRYVEFLFEWDDIRRTKNVLHNVVKLFLEHQVDELGNLKAEFDQHIAAAEQTLKKLAGITDWSPLGDVAANTPSGSSENPAKGHTSGSMLLAHHFRNNAGDLTVVGSAPSADAVQSLFDALLTALSKEGHVLSAVYQQLQTLASKSSSMSIGDFLKALVVILADGLLSSVQVVVDALVDILISVASTAIDLLDSKIHIPIISDILNLIGIPDLSFLDLFTWIAAVGYTVVYKIAEGDAPFKDDEHVTAIIQASNWNNLVSLFGHTQNPQVASRAAIRAAPAPAPFGITIPQALQKAIYITGHATAGFCLFASDFVTTFEVEAPTGDNPFSTPSAVLGVIVAAMQGGADALVPRDPVENLAVGIVSKVTTVVSITAKILFCGPVQKKLGASSGVLSGLAVNDGRATSAIVNSILTIPALFVSCWHFYELSEKPESKERSASIIGEVTNMASYISRISYAVAANDKDELSRQIPIGVMVVANLAASGLQTAESVIW